MQPATNERIEFIDLPEVTRRVCLTKTTIYKMVRQNQFPRFVKLGRKAARWDAAEIDAWQREHLAARAA